MAINAEQCVRKLLETTKSGVPKEISSRYAKLAENSKAIADGWLVDHKATVDWARDLISRPTTWCANDTETTHFNETAEILEVAIIGGDGESVLDELVCPRNQPNPRTVKIHGISPEMLRGRPMWPAMVGRVNAAFARYNEVLIYNKAFEERLYAQSGFGSGCAAVLLPPVVTDPLERFAAFCGEWDWAHNGWKYPKLEGGHRAAGDCRQMISIIQLIASSPIEKLQ